MITIQVLGFGELYQQLLNAVAAFMRQDGFASFLKLTALVGIIMASVGYLKQRDPSIYAKWVLGYVLVFQMVIMPKTSVGIYDISAQKMAVVANVPVVFAVTTSLITTVGVGLAESYDALLSLPDDLTYTKTGSLFGSKIIQASRDFRIIDPQLKGEMSEYLRNCVVGDIRLNHKYSVSDLSTTQHIWDLISKQASPVRMTVVNGERVRCQTAASASGNYSLRLKLNAEIKKAYTFFGVNLFGRNAETTYEKLFETHLSSSFDYYQMMTDTSADIFLQSMMINAIGDGIKDYQAFTDSTAGVVNNQVTKSQVQHRWSWAIAGQKAAWFLPILHTLLSVLLFGIFPVIIVMSTLPNGVNIFRGYIQFFISLQFWPVLFAILNAAMTMYGKEQSAHFGGLTMVNIDKIDELHSDLSGIAGYLMLMIPFLAKGLVSNLSDAFSNLATSMTGHLQGSAMSVANDAANASFSFGQTSFYNTSANAFSANKHDNNWSHMHGMHSEQLATGVVKTHTASGETVFDVSPGMSKSAVSISSSDGLSGSFNQALEESRQSAINESQHFQTSLSNASHKAMQLSQLQGHDMRLGDGVSVGESSQYSQALSTMTHIASDVAKRMGVSSDDAMTRLVSGAFDVRGGASTNKGVVGQILGATIGVEGSASLSSHVGRSSSHGDRFHDGVDETVSAKQASDFNKAFNHVQNFVKNHHFDETQSQGASLSNQMGADFRSAATASQNFDASLSRSTRINQARSYAESNAQQITSDLNQAFPAFVESQVGAPIRDALFSHPGNRESVQQLNELGGQFIRHERDELINKFGQEQHENSVDNLYSSGVNGMAGHSDKMRSNYTNTSENIANQATDFKVGIQEKDTQKIHQTVQGSLNMSKDVLSDGAILITDSRESFQDASIQEMQTRKKDTTGLVIPAIKKMINPKE